ncbi:hypothetical protein ACIQAC_29590 [Streptomyces sp. NPDC088387]|uniref:hypothetical protein n=1 Tax=Streptomyces sp. NPDC088387 TaxID=3365859 RepID=UPI0037FE1FEE
MPFPLPPRTRSGPRRRTLLATAAGTLLLAGCTSDDSGGTSETTDAADRARERAARDSRALAERYDAVLAAHPALTERLRPLRDEVVRHEKAFAVTRNTTSPSPSPSGASPGASADPTGEAPGDEKSALAALAGAERTLADRRAKQLLDVPGELARLLASVAAAGAAHAYLLTEGKA